MRSLDPHSPASPGALLVVRPVAITSLVVVLVAVVAWTLGLSSYTAGRVATYGEGQCVTREECIANGDEIDVLVGPGHVDSFNVKCLRTAATLIEAPCGQISYEGRVPTGAAAPVVVGDSAITATSGGITFAAGERFGGNVRREYCRTSLDAGVTVEVRALCSSAP